MLGVNSGQVRRRKKTRRRYWVNIKTVRDDRRRGEQFIAKNSDTKLDLRKSEKVGGALLFMYFHNCGSFSLFSTWIASSDKGCLATAGWLQLRLFSGCGLLLCWPRNALSSHGSSRLSRWRALCLISLVRMVVMDGVAADACILSLLRSDAKSLEFQKSYLMVSRLGSPSES
jgi:hypothetical protein